MEKTKTRIRLSVIIPTLDRSDVLHEALRLLNQQIDNKTDEIIVVEGANGPAKARNEAMQRARGKLLLFLNDDSFVDDNFIERHLMFHQRRPEISRAMVGFTQNHPDTVNIPAMKWLVGQSGLHFNYLFTDKKRIMQIPWYYLWTCNLSMKNEFVRQNDIKFCEEFPTAAWEDIEFAYRAKTKGLKLFYDGLAVVWHYHELGLAEIKSRFISHGRGLFHLESKLPINFLPFLVKSGIGKMILDVGAWKIWNGPQLWLEKNINRYNVFPNMVMQIMVILWKSQGYHYEKVKMLGVR
ncbi:MAG: glycosyltransferase [Microgenomates group bacterium]